MSLLGNIGHWFRNEADNVGSLITGQPAHSAPTPQPQAQAPPAQQAPAFHPSTPAGQLMLQRIGSLDSAFHPAGQPQQNNPNNPFRTQAQTSTPPPPHPNLLNRDFSNAASHLVGGIISPATNLAGLAGNEAKTVAADITHNQIARQNAITAGNQNVQNEADIARGLITKPAAELVTSLDPSIHTAYHPGPGIQQGLFGKAPIQNIETKVAHNFDTHSNLPWFERGPLAVGEAVGSLAQDLPVASTALKLGKEAATATKAIGTNEIGAVGKNVNKPNDPLSSLKQEALKYKSADEFAANTKVHPDTARVFIKSKFRDGGGYADVPITRKEDNITLYQGGTGEQRQFWTPNKEYAKKFGNGEVVKKTGSFYKVDNGNRMTDVYVEAKPQLTDLYNQAHAEAKVTQPTQGAKGFIEQESKPLPDGSKIVIKNIKNPDGPGRVRIQQRVDKNTDQPFYSLPDQPPEFLQTSPDYKPPKPVELTKTDRVKLGLEKKTANIPHTENPVKIELSNPNASEYDKAIVDKQRVQSAISTAARLANHSIKNLSDADKELFPYVRENPSLISKAKNPERMQDALNKFGRLTDISHAYDVASGSKTPHIENYYRHIVDLSDKKDANRFNEIAQQRGFTQDPFAYNGLNNQPRVFKSIQEAEDAGFKVLNKNPLEEIKSYADKANGVLGNQVLSRGLQLADSARGPEAALTEKFKLAPGRYVDVSPEAAKAAQSTQRIELTKNPAIKGLRTANAVAKSSILSAGQFHTINIGALRAAPTLIAKGHPVAAAKGLYGMFRAAFGNEYADRVIGKALEDGTVDKAAQIGMPYGGGGYNVEGTFLKHGIGNNLVFGKQIPMMHDQVVRSILSDLEKKDIQLDSPEAREAGLAGANLMGELNKELQHIPPRVQQAMTDYMLAGQFTPSKFIQVGRAVTKGGVGGSYARANVAANVAATAAVAIGVGYALHQKSDNIKDMLLRALIDPSVPTPNKDTKGNTIRLKTAGTDTSDIAKLLGMKLTRNKDGHLGVGWNPSNLPSTVSDFLRARLAPLPSSGLKVATNTTYAGKPLYDPQAQGGKKVIQGATSVVEGLLPIGLAGLPQTSAVEKHLPGSSQEVLDAQKPGTNPLLKSIGSSLGLTPSTDTTVGKGLQSSQYFDALNKAKSGLSPNDLAAFNSIHQQTKDPVTGQYVIKPTVFDSESKAALYLQHPDVLTADTKLNKTLEANGQSIDPFFNLSPDKQKAYLQYQLVNKNNTGQLTVWKQNNPWYGQFEQDRAVFYNSLPPGDPNKPKSPIQPPTETGDVQAAFNQYDSMTDPVQKAAFFGAHPELGAYEDAQADYINKLLAAQGLTPLKPYPKADPDTASYTTTYMNADKATRKQLRTGNPQGYQNMQAYLQNVDEYEVAKNGALDQFQGQTPNQKLLKGINSLSTYDMVKNPDGSLALKYGAINPGATTYGSVAAPPQEGATPPGSSFGSGSAYHKYTKKTKAPFSPLKKYRKINIRHPKKHKIYLKKPASPVKIHNKTKPIGIKSKTYQ